MPPGSLCCQSTQPERAAFLHKRSAESSLQQAAVRKVARCLVSQVNLRSINERVWQKRVQRKVEEKGSDKLFNLAGFALCAK
ncbi:hypothetical protein pipiens_015966 [Culex pipiens pipiens]|uniref:Uncharacterized protein n=1 Tax=Culex pipiens pipiens TaxID=38569 RepID=A0ABD1CN85_CULPP